MHVALTAWQVTALEACILRLVADEEVVSVTAGPDAQQDAIAKLQAARATSAAVEPVGCGSHLVPQKKSRKKRAAATHSAHVHA